MQETRVRSLCWEDPLKKDISIHSSILTWKIPWTKKLGGLQSRRLKESDTTERPTFTFKNIYFKRVLRRYKYITFFTVKKRPLFLFGVQLLNIIQFFHTFIIFILVKDHIIKMSCTGGLIKRIMTHTQKQ